MQSEEAFERELKAFEQELEATFGPIREYFDGLLEKQPEEYDIESERDFHHLFDAHRLHKNGGNYFLVMSRTLREYGNLPRTVEFVDFAKRLCAAQGIDMCFGTELEPVGNDLELERRIAIGIKPEDDYKAKVPTLLETYAALVKKLES